MLCLMTAATTGFSDHIALLHMRLKDGAISLRNLRLKPGKLKKTDSAYRQAGTIEFEAVSREDKVVLTGAVDDPAVRRLEYEDPDNPGRLKTLVVREPDADFMVRVPWNPKIKSVRFFRLEKDRKAGAERLVRKPLASVDVSQREK